MMAAPPGTNSLTGRSGWEGPRARAPAARRPPKAGARRAQILGCAMVKPLGAGADGRQVAEVGAFCVAPACRGSGKGDSLLDFLGAAR